MSKKYMRDVDFYDEVSTIGLLMDEAYIYGYLSLNRNLTLAGLYSIQMRRIMFETGIEKPRLEQILQRLANFDLIIYDAQLMFVSRIPQEQNLSSKSYRHSVIKKCRDSYIDTRSDLGTASNKAYEAFLEYHKAELYEIDEQLRMESGEAPSEVGDSTSNDDGNGSETSLDDAMQVEFPDSKVGPSKTLLDPPRPSKTLSDPPRPSKTLSDPPRGSPDSAGENGQEDENDVPNQQSRDGPGSSSSEQPTPNTGGKSMKNKHLPVAD